jgi:flagellar motor switch protein FliG
MAKMNQAAAGGETRQTGAGASKSGGTHKEELSGKQKAAIFLVTLGSDISSEIFKHLREDEIETLTWEIARLENIEPEERDMVLQEFQELMMAQDFITSGGIDYARELLEKSLGNQKAVDIINRLTSSLKTRPFDFIRRTDPANLLNLIQQEHPQTISLILAYLEPAKASQILAQLPQEKQSDVAKRIATMDRTSPEILREVERVLDKKLSSLSHEDYTAAGGVESIVDILNLVDRTTEKSIIESLEEEDPELAEEIKKRMFVFEDIVMLDDRAIQRVLRKWIQTNWPKLSRPLIPKCRIRFSAICPKGRPRSSRRTWITWDRHAGKTWRNPNRRSYRLSGSWKSRETSSSPGPARKTSWFRTYRGILWRKMYSIPWKLSI